MKRITSFALALLLTFSLTTAGYAGYDDWDSVTHAEAVETLTVLGVLAGYEDNTFRPQRYVTRAEAAKIICYILIGTEAADALTSGRASFTDVAGTYWANPYIEYCVMRGVIAGYGDGRFGPGDNVTAAQMAKMLLTSVGFGALKEYEGAGWMKNTVEKARSSGIEILSKTAAGDYSAPATREQIAQYTHNALTIPNMVKWDAATGAYVNLGVNLMLSSFGVDSSEKSASYADPEQYASEGWSRIYRNELVDGLYYNNVGYAVKESDYRDMLSKRDKIYTEVIKAGMDEYDKVQAIHDWICDNVVYNHDAAGNMAAWKPTKSPYRYEHQLGWAALMLGTAVCAGYSDAYQFLLEGLGIESRFIYGPTPGLGGRHAWNLVKIDRSYYHVDVTWSDQESYINYHYFLTSDDVISSVRGSVDYREWDREKFPACPRGYSFPTVSASVNDPAAGMVEGTFIGWGKGPSAAVKGTVVYISARAASGYEFDYWEVASGGVTIKDMNSPDAWFVMMNSNTHIRACFKHVQKEQPEEPVAPEEPGEPEEENGEEQEEEPVESEGTGDPENPGDI